MTVYAVIGLRSAEVDVLIRHHVFVAVKAVNDELLQYLYR
jgi:hypothetical protein